jgi:uncharacterized protein (DUF362 family)
MDILSNCTRRDFLRDMGLLAGGAAASSSNMAALAAATTSPDLVVVGGDDPKAMVKKAVAALGGMKKFVSRGDVVVVKPNMAWVRRPEQAANTNPDVIVALVEMAFDAGAKTIKIFDRGAAQTRDYREAYAASGIADAARKAGASVLLTYDLQSAKLQIKDGVFLKESLVWKDALECDCFINVPVAKQHGVTQLTLAMKNHLGLVAGDRGEWHRSLDQAIADFSSQFKPKLTVLDAYRIVVRNGPHAGSPQDVQLAKKCIAGENQVSVDAYGTTLFGKQPTNVRHIAIAGKMGLGEIDLAKLKIAQVTA